MARKRKSRSTSGVGYSAIRRKAEPVNPFERKRNRYTPKCLMLPLLWRFFPDHPNLLPAWFEGEKSLAAPGESSVRKPIYSREGGNATIFDDRKNVIDYADSGYADEPMIYQAFQPLPRHRCYCKCFPPLSMTGWRRCAAIATIRIYYRAGKNGVYSSVWG